MIYVTLGTMFLDFKRLVSKMDAIAERTGERVVIQLGLSRCTPQHAEHFDFRPHEELLALQRGARVVVAHAGIGATIDALDSGRPLIVVPRRKMYNEHMTDHQLDIAGAVSRRGWGRMVLDVDELDEACADPPPVPESYRPARAPLIASVRALVEQVAAAKRR